MGRVPRVSLGKAVQDETPRIEEVLPPVPEEGNDAAPITADGLRRHEESMRPPEPPPVSYRPPPLFADESPPPPPVDERPPPPVDERPPPPADERPPPTVVDRLPRREPAVDTDRVSNFEPHVGAQPGFVASGVASTEEDELQRRSALQDLRDLATRGVKLTKEWCMEDPLDDMLLELRRQSLAQDERSNVNMLRDSLRLVITGVEMVNQRFGLLDLDGWSQEACRELDKHDANLARIYRKYWRRGTTQSPEASIAMSLFGSMGMHHLRRTMTKSMMNRSARSAPSSRRSRRPQHAVEDSSDEDAPQ